MNKKQFKSHIDYMIAISYVIVPVVRKCTCEIV